MDSISTAIMAALATGVAGQRSVGESGESALAQAYQALKIALREKYGANCDLVDAIEKLEQKPTSEGRKQVLKEEVAAVKAAQEREIIALVNNLLEQISTKLDNAQPAQTESPLHLQRPAPAVHFVGRKVELAQLLAALQPVHIVALCGSAGVGKSALVAEAVWKVAPAGVPPLVFPDGIIYHNFYNQPRVDIALERIARTFNERLTPTPYDAAQRALVGRQALLVLDGADQADDLQGFLTRRGGCGVLLTCRELPEIEAEQQYVAALPVDDAMALLQAWGESYARAEPAAREICKLVGGLPLAVKLAGHYLTTQQEAATDYLAWLKSTALVDLAQPERQQQSIPLILEHTLGQVDEIGRQLLAVAGLFALEPFSPVLMTEAITHETHNGILSAIRRIFRQKSRESGPDIQHSLDELEHFGLLQQTEGGYRVAHPLIHRYAEQHLTVPPKALRRLATYFISFTWEQSSLGPEGQMLLDANRSHFMRVLAKCLEWQDWEAAHSLAVAIEDYLDFRGYITERIIANEVGLVAAWQLGRTNEAAWMGNLGDTYRTMGQAKWAIEHFEKALAAARRQGDWQSEANWLGNLGLAYRDLGKIKQARQYLKESEAIFDEIRSPKAALVRDWLAELEDREEK